MPGSGRSPGVGNGNPIQYSCLENPVDTGAWQTIVHNVAESQTRLSANTHTHPYGTGGFSDCCCLESLFWRGFYVFLFYFFLRFDPVNSYLRVDNLTLGFVKVRTEWQQVTPPLALRRLELLYLYIVGKLRVKTIRYLESSIELLRRVGQAQWNLSQEK